MQHFYTSKMGEIQQLPLTHFEPIWEKQYSSFFIESVYAVTNFVFTLVPPLLSKSSLAFQGEKLIGWSDVVDWFSPYIFTATFIVFFLRCNVTFKGSENLVYLFVLLLVVYNQGTAFHLSANSISNRWKYDNATHVIYNYNQVDERIIEKEESSVFKATDWYDSWVGHQWLQIGYMGLHIVLVYAGQTYGSVKPLDEGPLFSIPNYAPIALQAILWLLVGLQGQVFLLYGLMALAVGAILGSKKNFRQHESMYLAASILLGGFLIVVIGAFTGYKKLMK